MGRIFAWKLKRVDSSDPSGWSDGYAWLSANGRGWATGSTPNSSILNTAKEYAKTLNDFESYKVAFNLMLSGIPKEYLCTNRLRSAEDYFYDPCEWGGQAGYCGSQSVPGTIRISIIQKTGSSHEKPSNSEVCSGSYSSDSASRTVGSGQAHFLIEAENVSGLKVFENGTQVTPENQNCSGSVKKYIYSVSCSSVGTYTVSASGSNASQQSKTCTVSEGSVTFSLSTSTPTVAGTTTTATATLTTGGTVSATGFTFPAGTCTKSGNVYTLTFPNHCQESSSGSTKSMTLTVTGVSGSTSGACSASVTITQQACEETCSPYIAFTTTPGTIPYSGGSVEIPYETNGCEGVTIGEPTCSGDAGFSVSKVSGSNKVKVTATTNEGASSRSTTVTIKATKSGKPDSTATVNVTQAGQTNRSIRITSGPSDLAMTGGTYTYTVSTEFVKLTGATITNVTGDSSAWYSVSFDPGSTSTSAASGSGTVTVIVTNLSNTGDAGSGDYTLSLVKGGYQTRNFKTSCSGSGDVCLSVTERGFTLNVSGQSPEGNESDSKSGIRQH